MVTKKGMRTESGNAGIHRVGACVLSNWFTDWVSGSLLTFYWERDFKSSRMVGSYLPNHLPGSSFGLTRGCMQRQTCEGPTVSHHLFETIKMELNSRD